MEELTTKIEDLKKERKENMSTEMAGIFESLAKYNAIPMNWRFWSDIVTHRKMEEISKKARPQKGEDWKQQMLNQLQKVVQADKVSQEIDEYFEEIKDAFSDCEVSIVAYNTFIIDVILHV